MSAGSAERANATDEGIDRVLALCAEALEISDGLNVSPEIGARLQEVICALEAASLASRSRSPDSRPT